MPTARVNGVELYYEQAGAGTPLIFCHEFAGDMTAWEPQLRFFCRRYRTIAYNYRGYPPSSVPLEENAYSHEMLVEDLKQLLDLLGIAKAHIVGLATGGNLALNFAIAHPGRVHSIVAAGSGAGTTDRDRWLAGARQFASDIESQGAEGIVANVASAPQRIIFNAKDPRGWRSFIAGMRRLSPAGAMRVMRNALMARKPFYELKEAFARLAMPILVMVGDQDVPAFEASKIVREHAPHAGLCVIPMCGHTLNSEEPGLFNRVVADFLAAVEAGRWGSWSAPDGTIPISGAGSAGGRMS